MSAKNADVMCKKKKKNPRIPVILLQLLSTSKHPSQAYYSEIRDFLCIFSGTELAFFQHANSVSWTLLQNTFAQRARASSRKPRDRNRRRRWSEGRHIILQMESSFQLRLIAGTANRPLAEKISARLNIPLDPCKIGR
jgi:hypothetical protein